jgi:hypothetical protein
MKEKPKKERKEKQQSAGVLTTLQDEKETKKKKRAQIHDQSKACNAMIIRFIHPQKNQKKYIQQ